MLLEAAKVRIFPEQMKEKIVSACFYKKATANKLLLLEITYNSQNRNLPKISFSGLYS